MRNERVEGEFMASGDWSTCPGCGFRLPASHRLGDSRYNASPECWQLYGELLGYTLTRADREFIHQYAVDAYAAQHATLTAPTIGAAFALIGLYLAIERGFTGREVQRAHQLLARRSKNWPRFRSPLSTARRTVADVLREAPGDARDDALRQWAADVWSAWTPAHARVAALVREHLDAK